MQRYEHFMKAALREAHEALKQGEFPVGCLLVHENKIVVTGSRMNSSLKTRNELDHAEIVALRRLNELGLSSIPRKEMILFCTLEPCLMCFSTLLLNGIRRIVYAYEDVMSGETSLDLKKLKPLYKEMIVEIVPHILREESKSLFKQFFSNPANDYWRGSLLAQYTLENE